MRGDSGEARRSRGGVCVGFPLLKKFVELRAALFPARRERQAGSLCHQAIATTRPKSKAGAPNANYHAWNDAIQATLGSHRPIRWQLEILIIFGAVLLLWIAMNGVVLATILSCLAAVQAPIIMMSQNRPEARDRLRTENDCKVNLKAELEIPHLHEKIHHLLRP